ncbi:DNA packaging terminase subunit 2 [Macropodid alphaherpesvirus 1]|uniref:DNA packaging terminase subunit 2 n=1 Tax=Macropodid alphaherpesvirus 1 TaxID=137443 RepID=A0A109QI96_9ALPH|nr:DNA packaging terminase subunit 2 [Macropodid alphaherpesvirus 1]AMB17005.1 DNA packaging terminase subunit 2 [Macropodid alphaherpesvirus 1]
MAEVDIPSILETASRARQKLLVLLGQLQTYIFQIELLKRCDPQIGTQQMAKLKLNILQVMQLKLQLGDGLTDQQLRLLTPLSVTVDLLLEYSHREGVRVLRALEVFSATGDPKQFFELSMGLVGPCPYHQPIQLETYGGTIDSEICFLHDVENFLKQLNYCHLITSPMRANQTLAQVKQYLTVTIGSGLIVPPEINDPSHPCFVCFEELCVIANQGTTVARRLADTICNHVTQQAKVRIDANELQRYLPHIQGISEPARTLAMGVMDQLLDRSGHQEGTRENPQLDSIHSEAGAILEAHDVFKTATPRLYAISEMRFWLISGNRERQTTMETFAANLNELAKRELHQELITTAAELAIFKRRGVRFDRFYEDIVKAVDMIDALILGGQATAPDDQIEALIRACYDHHLTTPLLQRLVNPERCDEEALRKLLTRSEAPSGGDEGTCGEPDTRSPQARLDNKDMSEPEAWADVVARAMTDVRERRRLYAERLTKRSLNALSRCVREQRGELEKMLRVSVYGDVLPVIFSSLFNGFSSRAQFVLNTSKAGTVIDNRTNANIFDAHRFMRASLLRHHIDSALLPAITHKFFELVNGPFFDHYTHNFAQPPNTALYYSVENVGLLPHLKEELARFILSTNGGGASWAISDFQKFYCFDDISGITPTQRVAWKYIRELIIATTLFTAVYRCGEIELRRPDHTYPTPEGHTNYPIGLYITYDTECPLIALVENDPSGDIGPASVVIYDKDVFSILYSILQYLAPKLSVSSGSGQDQSHGTQ